MEENTFNIWAEKLNIGSVISEIGSCVDIRLVFDGKGHFMVSGDKTDYYPSNQQCLVDWKYETHIQIKEKDCEGDWPKYAAEEILFEIEKQIKNNGLRVVN